VELIDDDDVVLSGIRFDELFRVPYDLFNCCADVMMCSRGFSCRTEMQAKRTESDRPLRQKPSE